jgi:hypothetical protein
MRHRWLGGNPVGTQVFTRLAWPVWSGNIAVRKNQAGSLDGMLALSHIRVMLQCSKNMRNLQGWDNGNG